MATENKKISQFDEVSSTQSGDILPIVRSSGANTVNVKITVKNFMENMGANVAVATTSLSVDGEAAFTGDTFTVETANAHISVLKVDNLTVQSNGIIIAEKHTPVSSSYVENSVGKVSFDDNYLYVRTANNVIKRVALSSF